MPFWIGFEVRSDLYAGELMLIPVCKPLLPSYSLASKYLTKIDESRIYSNRGPLVQRLETAYSKFLQVPPEFVVITSSATTGLEGLIATSRRNRWVVPSFTFPATGLAVLRGSKELLLADVDADSWLLDKKNLPESAFASEVGLLPVMPFGAPVAMNEYDEFDEVVFDAAASLGAELLDLKLLKPNWSVVFSLHATKVLPAGEGGVVVCGSRERAGLLRSWINFGFSGTRSSAVAGTNAKMPEMIAAYALASLDQKDQEKSDWRERLDLVCEYTLNSRFANPCVFKTGFNPYWIVKCESPRIRERIQADLRTAGVDSRAWWGLSLDVMPAFESATMLSSLRASQDLAATVLGLPMYRDMPLEQIERIWDVLSIHA